VCHGLWFGALALESTCPAIRVTLPRWPLSVHVKVQAAPAAEARSTHTSALDLRLC
jgi:hypothetical protein